MIIPTTRSRSDVAQENDRIMTGKNERKKTLGDIKIKINLEIQDFRKHQGLCSNLYFNLLSTLDLFLNSIPDGRIGTNNHYYII